MGSTSSWRDAHEGLASHACWFLFVILILRLWLGPVVFSVVLYMHPAGEP